VECNVKTSSPTSFTSGFNSEADFDRIPGAHLIDQDNVFPSVSPGYFVTALRSAKTNLSASIFQNDDRAACPFRTSNGSENTWDSGQQLGQFRGKE
jgi:hypothetical protein